jgi:dipeptidyl-peptidase-4
LPTGRSRLYHISHDGKRVTPLTPGDFDARDFSVSPEGDFLLVTGDADRGTIDQHVYRAAIPPQSSGPQLQRMTEQPGWHTADLSPDGRWFVDVHSSAVTPPSVSVRSTSGESQRELFQGRLVVPGELIQPKIFHIPADDGALLPAMLIQPQSASTPKMPVLIEVYGGPRAATVVNRWSGTRMLYRQLLARRGIATLMVDNRSSAGRGLADTWSIQGRVGELEFSDLMTAVDWLHQQDWVAQDRLAIRGWSFGGFLTLYAMTHSDAFAAGVAGGSVTDWREYDAFYTERYMGLPSENEKGYDETAPVRAAEALQGDVLLIHGESDDNVHPSGTMRMARALQEAGKQFELMIYPDEAHAIHRPGRVWHLSQLIDQFLLDHLRQPPGGKR